MATRQAEFPLKVAICAWCRPDERGTELGSISHGICMRHLRKLKLETQGLMLKHPRRLLGDGEERSLALLPL